MTQLAGPDATLSWQPLRRAPSLSGVGGKKWRIPNVPSGSSLRLNINSRAAGLVGRGSTGRNGREVRIGTIAPSRWW